jgi:hypothetical protein
MQSQAKSVALPQPAQAAHEECFPNAAVSFGWDAHEVWRTRIKAASDARLSSNPLAREIGAS